MNREQKELEAKLDWKINKIGEDHLWKKITGKAYISDKEYKYLSKKLKKAMDKGLRPLDIVGICSSVLFILLMAWALLDLNNII